MTNTNQIDQFGSVDQLISNPSTKWKQVGITVAGDEQGTAGDGPSQLNTPYDLAFDGKSRYFYVADHENGRIQRYSVNDGNHRAGLTALKIDDGTAINPWNPDDRRNKPAAIFIDNKDNIYVAEMYQPRRILKLSPDKTSSTVISPKTSILQSCSAIFVDKEENIYISDWSQFAVLKFDKHGKNGQIVAGGNGYGDAPNQIYHPTGIFVAEKTGNVYVADYLNHRVQCWTPGSKEGVIVCGGNDAGNHLNQLNHPCSVIVDADEKNIYVGDCLNARVVRWSAGARQGEVVVGGDYMTGTADQLCRVGGIKFDRSGNLYVTDIYRNQVRMFSIEH